MQRLLGSFAPVSGWLLAVVMLAAVRLAVLLHSEDGRQAAAVPAAVRAELVARVVAAAPMGPELWLDVITVAQEAVVVLAEVITSGELAVERSSEALAGHRMVPLLPLPQIQVSVVAVRLAAALVMAA